MNRTTPPSRGRRWLWLLLPPVLLLAAFLLLLARAPVDPVAWSPPQPPELEGVLAPNTLLREAELLGRELAGPEDVDVDDLGRVYCGLADGTVRRWAPSTGSARFERFAATGGRPLGLDFDSAGTLWVSDSRRGLLSIDPAGVVSPRVDEVDGIPVHFADDVAVAGNGKVYFSDASTRFGPDELLLEVMEARPHGRLLEYDPASDRARVLLEGLYFANGVAVAPDDRFVLVAETFRYRIRRFWLRGPDAGRDEILIDNLPGFPDGVSSDGRGTYWVALYGRRSEALDLLVHPRRWLKRLIASASLMGESSNKPYGLVLQLDDEGRILRSLHDPGGERISHLTSVEPHGNALYLGSVEAAHVGRLPLD
jgi:sugar lactone lactonase YvrE